MSKAQFATIEKDSVWRIVAAILGALGVSALFTLFGYSDYEGATASHFLKEFGLALASYVPAAIAVQYLVTRWDSRLLDGFCIGLLGSILSWPMKLLFVDGQNGIPAYIANAAREHSWRPYADLLKDGCSFIVFTTILSLPFIAIGLYLCGLCAKKNISTIVPL